MKKELDKDINFIDYFLVVRIPLDIDGLNEKFKDNFQSKVISYFPNFEKHTIAFDDSIVLHCFPSGSNKIIMVI